MIEGLTFEPEPHIYRFRGVVVPSVTQVLEASGVVDYSYLPPAMRKFALQRGSLIHLATQYDDEGDLDLTALDETLVPYVHAWRAFRRDTCFEPEVIEERVYDPNRNYAGSLDRAGFYLNRRRVVVDLKSNNAEAWVALQLAAYAQAFEPDQAALLDRVCVELHGDGTYRIITYRGVDQARDFSDFACCLRAYQLQQQYGRLAPKKERAA